MAKSLANPPVGIIGGGAAGMSCALWLTELGHAAVIVERRARLGGQLQDIHRVNRWVLGCPGLTSPQLAAHYAEHIAATPASIYLNSRIVAIDANNYGYQLGFASNGQQHSLAVSALVVATGVTALGVDVFNSLPGFATVHQAGLISCFPLDHLDQLAELNGRQVAVIGGGDNAHYTAKDAALAGAHVHLIMRSPPKAQLSVRAEIAMLADQGLISEYHDTVASAFRLGRTGLELRLRKAGEDYAWLPVEQLFIRAGFTANSGFLDAFAAFAALNKQTGGYLPTDAGKRTNLPWLYAVGDVSNPRHQSVVGAIADGALAAQDFNRWRA